MFNNTRANKYFGLCIVFVVTINTMYALVVTLFNVLVKFFIM